MKRKFYKKPLSWLLWHPFEGLWNWNLLRVIRKIIRSQKIYEVLMRTIILLDTIILLIRAFGRRLSKVGLLRTPFLTTTIPDSISILYFDLGTHKEAKELSIMVNKILPCICKSYKAYGFEASKGYFEQAQEKFVGNKKTTLIHAALCHVLPNNGKIKLFKSPSDGIGSSIYRKDYNEYEEVVAIRFSDWLRKNNLDLKNNICLLRMNIEGAEYDVITDLVESGLAKYIDGYYGMWDDVSKIDHQRNNEFRALLSQNHIFPFTFNGRDLQFPLRLRCIEYDILTNVQAAVRRIKKLNNNPHYR